MDYKYICIECRNTFEPEFNKLKCTSGDCKYLDTSCYDIIFENNDFTKSSQSKDKSAEDFVLKQIKKNSVTC